MVNIIEYSIPIFKKEMGYTIKKYDENNYELVINKCGGGLGSLDLLEEEKENKEYDYKLDNSISRSRTAIFDIAMCNDFDYFVTLTLNPKNADAFDLDGFIKTFGQFIRNYRRRNLKRGFEDPLQYLLIPEQHKSGAWHMHGLIKGIPEEDLFKNNHGYLDWGEYKKRFGYISLSPVISKIAVSKYITKYITKDFAFNKDRKHKKLYYATRGLKRADAVKKGYLFTSQIFRYIKDKEVFENNYVIKQELNLDQLKELQKSLNISLTD